MAKFRSQLNRVTKAEKVSEKNVFQVTGFDFSIVDIPGDVIHFPEVKGMIPPNGFTFVDDNASMPIDFMLSRNESCESI